MRFDGRRPIGGYRGELEELRSARNGSFELCLFEDLAPLLKDEFLFSVLLHFFGWLILNHHLASIRINWHRL